jgi:hypothetical protein
LVNSGVTERFSSAREREGITAFFSQAQASLGHRRLERVMARAEEN